MLTLKILFTIFRAENCGTKTFLEAHMLPNIILMCNGHNLIIPSKVKQVFNVLGSVRHGHNSCPTLKEFALRVLYVWKMPFSKDHVPMNLYEQLLSGPAATCMQCLRPMFTYIYICLSRYG